MVKINAHSNMTYQDISTHSNTSRKNKISHKSSFIKKDQVAKSKGFKNWNIKPKKVPDMVSPDLDTNTTTSILQMIK